MLHIDLEKATSLLDQCVEERGGEYVYKPLDESCVYVHGYSVEWGGETDETSMEYDEASSLTPGCIVGLALVKAGVPMEAFLDLGINDFAAGTALDVLEENGLLTFTEEARNLFGRVQGRQDNGKPWGMALGVEGTSIER